MCVCCGLGESDSAGKGETACEREVSLPRETTSKSKGYKGGDKTKKGGRYRRQRRRDEEEQ